MKLPLAAVLLAALVLAGADADCQEAADSFNPTLPAESGEEEPFRDPFADDSEDAGAPTIADPLQKVNRAFFTFNDKLYSWVLKPIAKGYARVAPEPFRQSIRSAFMNARYPVRFVNNLLQGKFRGAGVETLRFLVNSTVGIGGLFDPAQDEWEFAPSVEDLDQTLGFYRFPTGIYLNWPVFGPSSVRGTAGMAGDSFLSPLNYVDNLAVTYGTRVGDTVNATSLRLGEYEKFKEVSFDPYISLRDAYVENRRSLIER
ncbi:MAG: VacJ family lipoprotein [Verrucomicrobiia bacterium]